MVIASIKYCFASFHMACKTYPTFIRSDDLCAYNRMQNKRFPNFFVTFTFGTILLQVIGDSLVVLKGYAAGKFLQLMAIQAALDALLLFALYYIANTSHEAACPRNKGNVAAQSSIRNKFMACGFIPAVFFMITPLGLPDSDLLIEGCEVNWLVFFISELYLSAWAIGELPYKIAVITAFNVGYCVCAVMRGCFTSLIVMRLVLPIAVSAVFIVGLDMSLKQNFLLKHGMKRQRNMYQNFNRRYELCGETLRP